GAGAERAAGALEARGGAGGIDRGGARRLDEPQAELGIERVAPLRAVERQRQQPAVERFQQDRLRFRIHVRAPRAAVQTTRSRRTPRQSISYSSSITGGRAKCHVRPARAAPRPTISPPTPAHTSRTPHN